MPVAVRTLAWSDRILSRRFGGPGDDLRHHAFGHSQSQLGRGHRLCSRSFPHLGARRRPAQLDRDADQILRSRRFPFLVARGPDHGPGKEHDQHQQDLAPSLAHEPPNTFPLRVGRTRLRRPASLPDRPIRIHTLPIHPTRTRRRASGPERRNDPQSVIGRISASLHTNPENPARSTWSTQSD